ncbi:MAG: LytR C-terminal domain-containing protein [Bacteroidota bacterium]|nr:LytR C-terminal domain-containing protein [Candidatus Kapabacteria bacterium]MCS7301950.1 LytR C-terminal domain-containing protein [Candidatus Kapabacteria bacterium]MDW8074787.1 LytR C-terminal domain-containing protein [Bacteroidota bacterium]MDW8271426.1 LytR C-terminal domain-containing protein [Bacteroidota bacterium]
MGGLRRLARWLLTGMVGGAVVVLCISLVWRMFIRPPVEPTVEQGSEKVIQVQVWNATDVPGLARQVQQYLRRRGFDVVEAGTAPTRYNRSVVIDRVGDHRAASQLQYVLDLPPDALRTDIDSDLVVHCSVIIGDDWQQMRPFRKRGDVSLLPW